MNRWAVRQDGSEGQGVLLSTAISASTSSTAMEHENNESSLSMPLPNDINSMTSSLRARNGFAPIFEGGPSIIVAVVFVAIIGLSGIAFFTAWYIREGPRCRRRSLGVGYEHFAESDVSLAEDTGHALNYFLLHDVPPERAPVVPSQSSSPSITDACDGSGSPDPNKPGRNESGVPMHTFDRGMTPHFKSTEPARRSPLASVISMSAMESKEDVNRSPSKPPSSNPARSSPRTPRSYKEIANRTPTSSPSHKRNPLRLPRALRTPPQFPIREGVPLNIHLRNESHPSMRQPYSPKSRSVSQNTVVHISSSQSTGPGSGALSKPPCSPLSLPHEATPTQRPLKRESSKSTE